MLQEFNIGLYPRKLWVATSWKEVKDKFTVHDADYKFEEHSNSNAVTYPNVERKSSRNYGVLIVFNSWRKDKGSELVNYIAHESLHAANAIFNELGIEYGLTNDEHAAYLVGWIAKCCWKVLQKEIYKENESKN